MKLEPILQAFHTIGLPTVREIWDFIRNSKYHNQITEHELKDFFLNEEKFDYYKCNEYVGKKRYSLDKKSDVNILFPRTN